MVSSDDQITDVLFFSSLHYLVTATRLGHLVVYKFDPSAPVKKNKILHTFKGHTKAIKNLKPVKNSQSSFVSASLDGSVRIWCLDKLIELYCFEISS